MTKIVPEHVVRRLIDNRKPSGAPYYVVDQHGCWIWQGYTGRKCRYGWLAWMVNKCSAGMNAHRAVYVALRGPIPDHLDIDHLCRVPACVNPDHLEPVTTSVNILRAVRPMKTHCPAGHPYDERNTRVDARGGRNCRICGRRADRERYVRKVGRPVRVYRQRSKRP